MTKVCRTCGTEKPVSQFSKQRAGMIGAHCLECHNANIRAKRAANPEKYRDYFRAYKKRPEAIAARKEREADPKVKARAMLNKMNWAMRNPAKRLAQQAVTRATRAGRLIRQPCEVCGNDKAQAHHDDYSKPLDVRWLCTTHHAEWHKHNTPLCPDQDQAA